MPDDKPQLDARDVNRSPADPLIRIRTDNALTNTKNLVNNDEMKAIHGGVPQDASSEGLTVLVQDSGIDTSHERLMQQVGSVEFHDFTGAGDGDAVGHGTLVSDLSTRVASGADIIVHRVFGQKGSGGFEPFRKSFEWMLDNPDAFDAFVMSWGVSGKTVGAIDDYVNRIAKKGPIPFAAAGNSGGATGSPATAKRAVSVGALGAEGMRMTNFSSWDQTAGAGRGFTGVPEVSAVGQSVVGARAEGTSMGRVVDENTTAASGTSFSNPYTANVGLDLIRRQPDITPRELILILEKSASDIQDTNRDGHGRLNWQKAAEMADAMGKSETVAGTVWSLVSERDWIQLDAHVLSDGEYVFDKAKLQESAIPKDTE